MITIRVGDCRDHIGTDAFDSIVCDPPYGLSFMGKGWDHGVPGVDFWQKMLDAAKPGCHLLAFGGTRTYHRLACAIEDAGWEIRDCIMWVYGSGFPKSHDVSKAIDRAAGAKRKVVGVRELTGYGKANVSNGQQQRFTTEFPLTSGTPATEKGAKWQGWGTALKPAWEPIIVARKPIDGTVAKNVMQHGTGAINVDGCRVKTNETIHTPQSNPLKRKGVVGTDLGITRGSVDKFRAAQALSVEKANTLGRFPANLIHDGSDEVVELFPQAGGGFGVRGKGRGVYSDGLDNDTGQTVGYGDFGSAARFFYCAKASKADRDEGCEELVAIHRVNGNKWTDQDYRVTNGERPPSAESGPRRNHHPTVKPTALMRYLCRLVTPPGGVVLDPFMGSGSTGKAAAMEGFGFVGYELSQEYADIAAARIAAATPGLPL